MTPTTKTPIRAVLIPFLTAVLISACSTKKDGLVYRTYNNTTSYFNGYFNANALVEKGVETIRKAHKEDYDEILPVFIYGTEETAKASYSDMEKAIEKCSRVIDKHEMKPAKVKDRKHPIMNKWMDDNLLLIGQAHFYKKSFYKAESIFNIVARKYEDESIQLRANTWLARTYIELEEYGKSASVLNRVEADAKMDDAVKAEYYLVYADHFLHQKELEKAAVKMEEALKYIHKKRDRARPLFILAQISQELGRCSEAQTYYKSVEKSRAPYELEFYSKINRAVSFCRQGMNSGEIRAELLKMLRDEKNEDYKDQIYYALADLELEEQHRDEAVDYFKKSLAATKDNPKQKAKTFLRLADLYFDEREYENAQSYYDSTLTNIKEDHDRYKEIKARAESLTELIGYLNTIDENDSIVALCNLDDKKLEKRLLQIQKQIEDDIQAEEEAAALAAAAGAEEQEGVTSSFWPYNANLKKKGYQNFLDTWGDRKLEDNWRRKNKPQTFSEETEELGEDPGIIATESTSDKREVPTLEELRNGLPCGDEAKMAAASASVAEAYYMSGVIYKEKLDDKDNAIDSWDQLVTNIGDSDFHPTAYYQLFRTYLTKEQDEAYSNPMCSNCNSKYWGDRIKALYPGSEWARLVDNPEYLDIKELTEAEERAAYELVYQDYVIRNYAQVISASTTVIDGQPNNYLRCKYILLRAVSVGYSDAPMGIRENYQRELNAVIENCPSSDEAKRAQELLTAFGAGNTSMDGGPSVEESTGTEEEALPEEKPVSPYIFNENDEQYLALIIPVKEGDMNAIKAQTSDFNTANYASLSLKVTNNLFDKSNHILLVKPFKTIQEAMDYMGFYMSDTAELAAVHSTNFTPFIISKMNYITLFKSKDIDQYLEFYHENY